MASIILASAKGQISLYHSGQHSFKKQYLQNHACYAYLSIVLLILDRESQRMFKKMTLKADMKCKHKSLDNAISNVLNEVIGERNKMIC